LELFSDFMVSLRFATMIEYWSTSSEGNFGADFTPTRAVRPKQTGNAEVIKIGPAGGAILMRPGTEFTG
jgi:hypothetical protein